MEKLRKTAGRLDRFFKIVFWIVLVLAGFMAVLGMWQMMALGMGREPLSLGLDLNIVFSGFILTAEQFSGNDYALIWGFVSVLNVIFSVFLLYSIAIIRRILQPMKEGRPFEKTCSLELAKLAWVSVLFAVVYLVLTNVGKALILHFLQVDTRLVNPGISIDLTFFIVAAVLFLVSYIFEYGEELQQLSDETL